MKKILVTGLILLFSITLTHAQEKDKPNANKTKLNWKFKDGAHPDIYVDGKKFEFSIDLLDTDRIATMNVLKGKEAIEAYNAPNGVIVITTKERSNEDKTKFIITDIKGNDSNEMNTKIVYRDSNAKDPMIIIDGKEVTRKELKKLKPEDIEAIEVLKDNAAQEAYGADNGVIIVKMKKQKKVEKQEKKKKVEKNNK